VIFSPACFGVRGFLCPWLYRVANSIPAASAPRKPPRSNANRVYRHGAGRLLGPPQLHRAVVCLRRMRLSRILSQRVNTKRPRGVGHRQDILRRDIGLNAVDRGQHVPAAGSQVADAKLYLCRDVVG